MSDGWSSVTLGEFLVYHAEGAPIEEVDSASLRDRDVRQDAMYRFLKAHGTRSTVQVDDSNVIQTVNSNVEVAQWHLRNAQVDKIRQVQGRSKSSGKAERTTRLAYVAMPMCKSGVSDCGIFEYRTQEIHDDAHDDEIEAIECTPSERLQEIWDSASKTERKAICLMTEWQRRKVSGEDTKSLHLQAHRLKRRLKKEGSAFQLDPRKL